MRISITKLYTKFPDYPKVLKLHGKVAFVTRIYTETAAANESDGWRDWTSADQPYYKFKYTHKGIRIVFIVSKKTEVDFDEFVRVVEKSRFFKAMLKYLQYNGMTIEFNYNYNIRNLGSILCFTDKVYILNRMFDKKELILYHDRIIQFLMRTINIDRCEVTPYDYVYCIDEEVFDQYWYMALPFKLVKTVNMTLEEYLELMDVTVTLRDFVRLINELKRREKRRDINYDNIPAVTSNPFKTIRIGKWFVNIIDKLRKRGELRPEWNERLKLFLVYHRHFTMITHRFHD